MHNAYYAYVLCIKTCTLGFKIRPKQSAFGKTELLRDGMMPTICKQPSSLDFGTDHLFYRCACWSLCHIQ